jgi:hypothetical protein
MGARLWLEEGFMPVHVSEEQLQSYMSGALSDEDSRQVNSHVDECGSCRTRLEQSRTKTQSTAAVVTQIDHDERRRERRMATNDYASVQVVSPHTLEHMEVRVLDISRNGLKIRAPKFLKIGAVLQMRLRDTLILGEVRYCVRMDDGFWAGLQIQDCVERRRAKRSLVDIPATLGELQNDQPAKIVDKSREGMLLVAQQSVPPGTSVCVIVDGKPILAEVVHCNREGGRFKIGVKIDQTSNS